MKWRLYFADGEFSGEGDKDAFAVPSVGMILLKQETHDEVGYSLRHSANFYCWERIKLSDGTILKEGRWAGKNDIFGLSHYYATHEGPQKVLIGIEIHDDTYRAISTKAATDGCLCLEPCKHINPRYGRG